jgi:threonine/homoserine/homoserine lactone efflux protein
MLTLNMFIFLCISFLAICGMIASLEREKNSETFLIVSNLLFILYGSYMAYIEK